jgi:hypothetical protein
MQTFQITERPATALKAMPFHIFSFGLFLILAYGVCWGLEFYRSCLQEANMAEWEARGHRVVLSLLAVGGVGVLVVAASLLTLFNFRMEPLPH